MTYYLEVLLIEPNGHCFISGCCNLLSREFCRFCILLDVAGVSVGYARLLLIVLLAHPPTFLQGYFLVDH